MINFMTESGIFNFRSVGILIKNGRVLVHREINDQFYSFPGGRVEMMEDSECALIREMKEELQIDINIIRMLWLFEHFFELYGNEYHELGFYYLIDCNDCSKISDEVFTVVENVTEYEFRWIPLDKIKNEVLYPTYIKERLDKLPSDIEKIVEIKK